MISLLGLFLIAVGTVVTFLILRPKGLSWEKEQYQKAIKELNKRGER